MSSDKRRATTRRLLGWFKKRGRAFPWRRTSNPYKIFVAEMLLQKTNVEKALPAYSASIKKFPNVGALAKANVKDLKCIIAPLGLIKRAEFLKKGAEDVVSTFGSKFPADAKNLKRIMGVGDYMANAILCFSSNKRLPLVDTNVARVYSRIYNYKSRKLPYADKRLWAMSQDLLPSRKFKEYNLALLDLSALICLPRNPLCQKCPCARSCFYFNRFISNA